MWMHKVEAERPNGGRPMSVAGLLGGCLRSGVPLLAGLQAAATCIASIPCRLPRPAPRQLHLVPRYEDGSRVALTFGQTKDDAGDRPIWPLSATRVPNCGANEVAYPPAGRERRPPRVLAEATWSPPIREGSPPPTRPKSTLKSLKAARRARVCAPRVKQSQAPRTLASRGGFPCYKSPTRTAPPTIVP